MVMVQLAVVVEAKVRQRFLPVNEWRGGAFTPGDMIGLEG